MAGLSRLRTPIDRPTKPRGVVHITEERCKECDFCVRFCPKDILEISDRYGPKGYRPVQVVAGKAPDCIACRFCEDVCPEFAISITEVDANQPSDPPVPTPEVA